MTCGTQAMVRPAMIRFRSISDMADLSRRVVIDWRQIAAERADPVTASNRDRITPQIHILLDQPGVPRSCFIEGQPLMALRPRQGHAPRHFGHSEEDPGGRLKDIGQLNLSPVDRTANRGSLLKPAQQTAGAAPCSSPVT